jgi:hypothetical protein
MNSIPPRGTNGHITAGFAAGLCGPRWSNMHPMLALMMMTVAAADPLHFPAPAEQKLEHCARAACTTWGDSRVCKCVSDGDPHPTLLLVDHQDSRVEWEGSAFENSVTDFDVLSLDLDGDGSEELVVASRSSEGGAQALRSWDVAVVDLKREAATHFVSQDWGPDAISSKRTLLVTEWEASAKPNEPLAFVGREYSWKAGRLELTREPVRRRKLDKTFEDERAALLKDSKDLMLAPRRLLSHPSTARLGQDPAGAVTHTAMIRGVTRDAPELDLYLEREDGALEYLSSGSEDGPRLRLGDLKSKRLYPRGYSPGDAAEWLVGRKAMVAGTVGEATGLVWVN